MELVIDANILMSALISREGKTYGLIFNDQIKLVSVDKLFLELDKYKVEVLAKSGLEKEDFELFMAIIFSQIEFIPKHEIERFVKEARSISPDLNDTEYFALALKLNCAIWSNDKKLKEQNRIKVYSTADLIKQLI